MNLKKWEIAFTVVFCVTALGHAIISAIQGEMITCAIDSGIFGMWFSLALMYLLRGSDDK